MISHARSSCVQNMSINIEDLEDLGISTRLLSELAALVVAPATAATDVGELSFFHVKRRDRNAQPPSTYPEKDEALPSDSAVAVGRPKAFDAR